MIADNLDIDRLHNIIDTGMDPTYARGQGRTTAFLALMVGEAELGDFGNNYLYVGENAHWSKDVAHQLADMLQSGGLNVTIRMNESAGQVSLFVGNDEHLVKTFRFVSARNPLLERLLRGSIYDDVFIDVTPETYDAVDPVVWLIIKDRKRLRS